MMSVKTYLDILDWKKYDPNADDMVWQNSTHVIEHFIQLDDFFFATSEDDWDGRSSILQTNNDI